MILKRPDRTKLVKIGDRAFLTKGVDASFFGDLFHNSMRVSWPAFFGGFAIYFLTMNLLFAGLFSLGGDGIANARPGSYLDLFFFSVETLATVGYGDMHPASAYAHLIVTLEIFTGLSTLAVFTGLIFARFSRPRAKVIFADVLTLGRHDGQTMLMARLANARHSTVSEAQAEIWLLHSEEIAEGRRFVRFKPLPLVHRRNPIFSFSWTLFHRLDESSPLHGLGADELAAMEARFLVIFDGLDDVAGQRLNVRRAYDASDLRFGHVYADILTPGEGEAPPQLDYGKIHVTEPEEG